MKVESDRLRRLLVRCRMPSDFRTPMRLEFRARLPSFMSRLRYFRGEPDRVFEMYPYFKRRTLP